jgi:hypothetical protein
VVTFAPTPSGTGYWLVAADGGVFGFGDAAFHGSTGGIPLARPVVAMAPTPTGRGYWLAASDGGVFAFGDAVFHGSTGGIRLQAPVVSIAPTPSGSGYWLTASDGGVFAFGDAAFHGSTGGIRLQAPVVSMAAGPSGDGYWLVAADGGVFSFGDAPFLGGLGGAPLAAPVAAAAAAPVPAGPGTAIFYYPWHANPAVDGEWRHWSQGGHQPPEDIGSEYYPVRGAYSNADPAVVADDMATIAAMGLDTVVVSWWGTGSYEDARLPAVAAEARLAGLAVGAVLEPYPGRSPARAAGDLGYLEAHGIRDVYVYEVLGEDMAAWRTATHARPGLRIFAQGSDTWGMRSGALVERASRGGFDGVFTYDPLGYGPPDYAQVCAQARARGLLCAPSVAPGFEAVRATGRAAARPRAGGETFDRHWEGALYAAPDVVTVTSWNEWHEGTQVEPARPRQCLTGGGWCYLDYEGAYGRTGAAAPRAYLERTAHWVERAAGD